MAGTDRSADCARRVDDVRRTSAGLSASRSGSPPSRWGRRVRRTAVFTAAGSLISAYRRKYVN
jgi:hypothetical protein